MHNGEQGDATIDSVVGRPLDTGLLRGGLENQSQVGKVHGLNNLAAVDPAESVLVVGS